MSKKRYSRVSTRVSKYSLSTLIPTLFFTRIFSQFSLQDGKVLDCIVLTEKLDNFPQRFLCKNVTTFLPSTTYLAHATSRLLFETYIRWFDLALVEFRSLVFIFDLEFYFFKSSQAQATLFCFDFCLSSSSVTENLSCLLGLESSQ